MVKDFRINQCMHKLARIHLLKQKYRNLEIKYIDLAYLGGGIMKWKLLVVYSLHRLPRDPLTAHVIFLPKRARQNGVG